MRLTSPALISFRRLSSVKTLATAASTLSILFLSACGAGNFRPNETAANPDEVVLKGTVHGGQQPIIGATIQLYAVGSTGDASAATPLIPAGLIPVTDTNGAFTLKNTFNCPNITTEVYLIAQGGNPGLTPAVNNQQSVLMTALGPCGNITSATHIIINEATTIGSIYPITPFMSSYLNVGSNSGDSGTLAADFMQINQYIDTDGGASPGPQLPGGFTAPVANLYSLANAISDCVNSTGGTTVGTPCGNLFSYAKPPSGPAPANTADAVLDIANNPTQNVGSIFALSLPSPAFQPALSTAPADWTLKILPNLTIATPSALVGVGSPGTGTLTLGQAAPSGGLTVNLVSSNTSFVTVTTPVNIPAGATTASFSYAGASTAGTATITASATGYYGSSVTLSSTTSLISLGSIPVVAPGNSTSLPLSLGTLAPTGGVTVNFTSSNPSVATVTPSIFIPAGQVVAASNPQVTGVTVGTTSINATATGYAPGSRNVSVSVTATLPATFSIPLTVTTNETLTISAPAPAGGIKFNLTSDSAAFFTFPSTVTVPAGATTVSIPLVGTASGTTNLRADSPNITEAISAVTVSGTINNYYTSVTTGKLLDGTNYAALGTTPSVPTTMTITSNNPGVFLISTSPTVAGSNSVNLTNVTGTGYQQFYIQGVTVGTGTYTVTATGYSATSVPVTVDAAGFILTSNNFTTTSLSPPSTVTLAVEIIDPVSGASIGSGVLGPAAGTVGVPVTSGTPAVGTVTSPANFAPGSSSGSVTFTPVSGGTSTLTLTTPSGFSTPAAANSQQITATVTSVPINFYYNNSTTGLLMQTNNYVSLSQNPLTPTAVTVTVADPTIAALSSSPTAAGAASVVFNSTVNSNYQQFYIQGLKIGSTTMTVTAPGYTSATVPVVIDASGFYLASGNFSTTSFSSASSLQVIPIVLNPSTLAYIGGGTLAPQAGTVNVPITSGTTTVGTVSSPVAFPPNSSSGSFNFTPVGPGTSTVSITEPAGFSTPSNENLSLTATVTAPNLNWYYGSNTTGVNLQTNNYVALAQTPPTPVTVTVASSNPAVATVSSGSGIAGAASLTFPNTVNANYQMLSVQGQSVGTSTLTVSAPGYNSASIVVTVLPSGFIINSGNINTTTFSPTSSVNINPVALNTGTLTVQGSYSFNPGIGNVTVPVTSSSTQIGTVTTPATFTAGSNSASVTFTPLAAGATNISIGTPAGYSTPAAQQAVTATVTAPLISFYYGATTTGLNLQTNNYVALGQTPPSAVTVTVTSASPSIATISTSPTASGTGTVTFLNTTTANYQQFYVQGRSIGTTTLTVSAPGYQNATINVTVDPSGFTISTGNINTTTFSQTTAVTVTPVVLTPGTLTVIGGAALAPGVALPSVSITSGTPGVGTITSPINFNVNDSSDSATFTPVSAGTTSLSIATPAGYSTPTTAQSITATVTAPPTGFYYGSSAAGPGMQQSNYAQLGQAPPAPTNLTISVTGASGLVALSKSPLVAGSSSITFAGLTTANYQQFYVQGLASGGSTTLTITAPGFASSSITVTCYPSGFVFSTTGIATNTFSSSSTVTVQAALLNSGVLTYQGNALIGPGSAISVPIVSSVPGVGTVTSPVVFNPGDSTDSVQFTPISNGTTNLSISQPAGFTTDSQSASQNITATVTAPSTSAYYGSTLTGINLQQVNYASLGQAPPTATTLTLTVNNPAIAVISTSQGVSGSAVLNFGGLTGTAYQTFYIQGLTQGSTTITISAPGFASTTLPVTVDLSGFVFSTGNFSTTASSAATNVVVIPSILKPGVLTVEGSGATLAPQAGSVSFTVGSTSPQIGTVSPTTLNFVAGQSTAITVFTPLTSGTTDIDIVSQPAGFTTPSQPVTQQIVVAVN